MRTIICRGKSRKTGEWVTGAYYETLGDHFIRDRGLEIEVEEDSVGEFTGCEDVNGVDIYEGDRVKCTLNTRRHEAIKGDVIFKNGAFGVKATDDSFYTFNVLALYVDRIEVMGVSGDD